MFAIAWETQSTWEHFALNAGRIAMRTATQRKSALLKLLKWSDQPLNEYKCTAYKSDNGNTLNFMGGANKSRA